MTGSQPDTELRAAAADMRDRHGAGHPRHEFWYLLAALLDERAAYYESLAKMTYGSAGATFVAGTEGDGDLDSVIAIAQAYERAGAGP